MSTPLGVKYHHCETLNTGIGESRPGETVGFDSIHTEKGMT